MTKCNIFIDHYEVIFKLSTILVVDRLATTPNNEWFWAWEIIDKNPLIHRKSIHFNIALQAYLKYLNLKFLI